jgi:hypothetical protein
VHVYTPHLSTMTFYADGPGGVLVPSRTELATAPEHGRAAVPAVA